MVYLKTGGFVFNAGGGSLSALFDGYYNPCVPKTRGLSRRQEVTVRVRQGITQDTVSVTVQQTTVVVPSQQNTRNPVRVMQPESVEQEIPVAQIPTVGNQALDQFNRNAVEEPGATFLIPPASQRMAQQATQSLGKEVAVQAATAADLADDAARSAASTVDDAALLANRLKNLSPAQIQQALQKTGVPFSQARDIANALGSTDEAAALLRQQGLSRVANISRQVTQTTNRVIATLC